MSDDAGQADDNVIPFSPPSASLRVDRELEDRRSCRHHHIEIRQRPRRLRCKGCRTDIDPFEYILYLAERWEDVFPKNEAARELEAALKAMLSARGSLAINVDGVTARTVTAHGQKLEAHESWGMHGFHGGAAGAIVAAVRKLEVESKRWGAAEIVYPRWTIEKTRGQKRWTVGVMMDRSGWETITNDAESVAEAYAIVRAEAAKLEKPVIVEQRPRRLWR